MREKELRPFAAWHKRLQKRRGKVTLDFVGSMAREADDREAVVGLAFPCFHIGGLLGRFGPDINV